MRKTMYRRKALCLLRQTCLQTKMRSGLNILCTHFAHIIICWHQRVQLCKSTFSSNNGGPCCLHSCVGLFWHKHVVNIQFCIERVIGKRKPKVSFMHVLFFVSEYLLSARTALDRDACVWIYYDNTWYFMGNCWKVAGILASTCGSPMYAMFHWKMVIGL